MRGNPAGTTSRRIAGGDLGTLQTLQVMRGAVNRGVRHPLTMRLASLIVSGVLHSRPAQAAAIRGWLDINVAFQPDPYGIEAIREVPEMLDDISALGVAQVDCDDAAILGAALGKAVGLKPRFTVLGFAGRGAPFRHVFAELDTGEGWQELDVTRPPSPLPPSRIYHMAV